MVVCFECFCLILQPMYLYWYVHVFLLLCMFCSVYSVFIVPTGTLRLSWLRGFRVFSSVLRRMPGYNPQRWHSSKLGNNYYAVISSLILVWPLWVRIPESSKPKLLILLFYNLFVCKCVLYYCHLLSTKLHLINTSIHQIPLVYPGRFSRRCLFIPPWTPQSVRDSSLMLSNDTVVQLRFLFLCQIFTLFLFDHL